MRLGLRGHAYQYPGRKCLNPGKSNTREPPLLFITKIQTIMPLPFAALIPLIAAGLGAGGQVAGGLISRGQSRGDIARQNAYNSPINQVARLKEAGLPMAALLGGHAGSQSALPTTSGEQLGKASEHGLQNYIITQTQLKQLDILKAEARVKNSEADKNEAERDWLLSGAGEDRAGTNLTRSLNTRYSIEQADSKGKQLANRILDIEIANKPYRYALENNKLHADIINTLKQNDLLKEQVTGAKLENKIKNVIARYQPRMSQQQLRKLMAENDLLDLSKSGKEIENATNQIRLNIERATEGMQISKVHANELMSWLTYDKIGEEFKNYKQYQEFVRIVQDNLKGKDGYNPIKFIEAVIAMAYTTVTGLSGQQTGMGTIIQGLK